MDGTHESEILQSRLKDSLKPYPRLYHTFFSKQASGGVSQDISVYKLLQVGIPALNFFVLF